MEFQIPLSREDLLQREGNRYAVEECCTSEELVTRLEGTGTHTHTHTNKLCSCPMMSTACIDLVRDGGPECGFQNVGAPINLIDVPPLPFLYYCRMSVSTRQWQDTVNVRVFPCVFQPYEVEWVNGVGFFLFFLKIPVWLVCYVHGFHVIFDLILSSTYFWHGHYPCN